MLLEIDPGESAGLLVLAGVTSGFAASPHCFAMCGPLACASCTGSQARGTSTVSYQLARIVAYGVIGLVLGALGAPIVSFSGEAWAYGLAALLLFSSAAGLTDRVPAVPVLTQILRRASGVAAKVPWRARPLVLGAVTPLLPCGLLVALYASAGASGSMTRGGLVTAAFAFGGVPALALAQAQASWLPRLPPAWGGAMRRVVPAVAACVLVYRAYIAATQGDCCAMDVEHPNE